MEYWRDIVPATPLVSGVPVVVPGEREWAGTGVVFGLLPLGAVGVVVDDGHNGTEIIGYYAGRSLRINLWDPQGMAHALRLLGHAWAWERDGLLGRWLDGETTEHDRVVVARALRDMVEAEQR